MWGFEPSNLPITPITNSNIGVTFEIALSLIVLSSTRLMMSCICVVQCYATHLNFPRMHCIIICVVPGPLHNHVSEM